MFVRQMVDWPTWHIGDLTDDLKQMRDRMERLFADASGIFIEAASEENGPPINVTENPDAYYLRARLPGVGADDLEVTVSGQDLILAGERHIPEADADGGAYHRRERWRGRFRRVLRFRSPVVGEGVTARFADGVPAIKIPKTTMTPKTVKID